MTGRIEAHPHVRLRLEIGHPRAARNGVRHGRVQVVDPDLQVHLHLLVDSKHGRLNGQRIRDMIPAWAHASVWFCGPPAFGEAVRDDLVAHGLDRADFHQELFQMR